MRCEIGSRRVDGAEEARDPQRSMLGAEEVMPAPGTACACHADAPGASDPIGAGASRKAACRATSKNAPPGREGQGSNSREPQN